MMLARIGSLGAATFVLTMITMAPEPAIAADPLLPTAAGWVAIGDGNKWVTTGEGASFMPPYGNWASIDTIQFKSVKIGNGPLSSVTSVTLERPRGQFDHSLGLPIGKNLSVIYIVLRKPAVNGQADWYDVRLIDPKVTADEIRSHEGATTSTEILLLTFSGTQITHRTQNAQGYSPWAVVPSQLDIVGNIVLPVPPPAPPGPARPTPPSGMRQ